MKIPLDQQRKLYDKHAEEATKQLASLLSSNVDRLIELGRERAFDTVGVHEYGDSTYWKTNEQLIVEAFEELADAIFYLQISIARNLGDLPSLAELNSE